MFYSSCFSVFGKDCPNRDAPAPDDTIQLPLSALGISSSCNESLGELYRKKRGVKFRALRYPAILAPYNYPTFRLADYAKEMFVSATKAKAFSCWLEQDVSLPFMLASDAIEATVKFIETDYAALPRRVYNLGGVSISPAGFAREIRRWAPEFKVTYGSDFRGQRMQTMPASLDANLAATDWGWKLNTTAKDMCERMTNEFQKLRKENAEDMKFREMRVRQKQKFHASRSSN